jgi:hypothetical protein
LFSASKLLDGMIPGAGDVLVKYTYYGETDLSGKADGSDYSRIDSACLHNKTRASSTGNSSPATSLGKPSVR